MHSPGFETKCACDNVVCRNESRIEPATSTSSLTATPAAAEDGTVTNYGAAENGGPPLHHHHDEHDRHRFVHSHRGELAGPIVSYTYDLV
jgi:hypothetical protein